MKDNKFYINNDEFEKAVKQLKNALTTVKHKMQLTSDSFKSVSEQFGLKNYNNKK